MYQFVFLKHSTVTLFPPDDYNQRKKKRHSNLLVGHLCMWQKKKSNLLLQYGESQAGSYFFRCPSSPTVTAAF